MHSFHFDDQYNTFHSYSYAVAPGGQGVVGDEEAFAEKKGAVLSNTVFDITPVLASLLQTGPDGSSRRVSLPRRGCMHLHCCY